MRDYDIMFCGTDLMAEVDGDFLVERIHNSDLQAFATLLLPAVRVATLLCTIHSPHLYFS